MKDRLKIFIFKQKCIPWRLKSFFETYFPVLCYMLVNIRFSSNSPIYWEEELKRSWESSNRIWPTKNELIHEIADKDEEILDVSCGNGSILRSLKDKGYKHLHGSEMSKFAIKKLSNEGINMYFSKLPRMELPNDSFDIVIISEVLEHIVRQNYFLKEVFRVVKKGGRVLIFVPFNCMGPLELKEHVRKYNIKSLEKLLQKKFKILNINIIKDKNHNLPTLFAVVQKHT